jgi:thiamine biosynthesis protein ThiI
MSLLYVCHYSEIGLKGRNQHFFIRALMNNIRRSLRHNLSINQITLRLNNKRVFLRIEDNVSSKEVNAVLNRIFGLAYFSKIIITDWNMENVLKEAVKLHASKSFDTFAIRTRRANKTFPYLSEEVNRKVGKAVQDAYNKKVKLKNPDIICFIEILDNEIYLYNERSEGPGGLPVGINGNVLVLISGGIDSPVASYFAMKRGARCHFIHFHSFPFTTKNSQDKVQDLITVLSKYQFRGRTFFIPFADAQQKIVLNSPEKYRIILFRRFMMRIAEKLAKKLNISALVTGESLGQVSSQTLENIRAIEEVTSLPILRPLIGLDKNEIIKIARKIGTYTISKLPHDDACTRFMPENPVIHSNLSDIRMAEKNLDIESIVQEQFESIEKIDINL